MATENFKNPEAYITSVGKVIRKTSLDELPQLFNVLKGDMSIIGPRPLIPMEKEVLAMRDESGASRVLPGITGLAQVHGRDEVTDENKAAYDGKYALNISIRQIARNNLNKFSNADYAKRSQSVFANLNI